MKKWIESDLITKTINDYNDNMGEIDKKLTEPLILENLIENGDFSDGTNGWIENDAVLQSLNGALKITGTGASLSAQARQTLRFEINNKYYVKAEMKVNNNLCTQFMVRMSNTIIKNFFTPIENQWYHVGEVVTGSDEVFLAVRHYYQDALVADGKVAEVKNVLVINLSQVFGVGNEPTKEEMDELMKIVPNQWWDGELTLEQKEVVQWLLKLESEKANKQQEEWITPTLLNGWENHRSDYDAVGFMKDEFGFVHMKGMISKGTIGATVFQLPMGYRPSKLINEFSRADNGVGYISITTLGTITITSHSGSWCTVNNICFKVGV